MRRYFAKLPANWSGLSPTRRGVFLVVGAICLVAALAFMALAVCLLVVCQSVAIAQNLGAAPQVNVAVQGQTGAQPEGAFLNFVNWVGNVIAPVGAGVAVVGGIVSYASGRGYLRWIGTALGLLAVSGLTRLLEFWIAQGGAGVA